MSDSIRVRPAAPAEAELLSSLALRSKASWGYPASWLELWRDELTISAREIESQRVEVAEDGERVLGFFWLHGRLPDAELEALWVDPESLRQGIGSRLLRSALEHARATGAQRLLVDSDPNATGFYEAHGAILVGSVPSLPPGRVLPRLAFQLIREG